MKLPWIIAGVGLAVVAAGVLAVWARSRTRYVIGRSSLRILCLGITVRRIPFTEIERVSKPKRDATLLGTETWMNTWNPDHRELVVHRKSGWRRRVLITPKHRYAFRNELREAIRKAGATVDVDEVENDG